MYILKLNPVFKDYLWGGTKLRDEYGFESNLEKLAEGWMLSCHKDGKNTIQYLKIIFGVAQSFVTNTASNRTLQSLQKVGCFLATKTVKTQF